MDSLTLLLDYSFSERLGRRCLVAFVVPTLLIVWHELMHWARPAVLHVVPQRLAHSRNQPHWPISDTITVKYHCRSRFLCIIPSLSIVVNFNLAVKGHNILCISILWPYSLFQSILDLDQDLHVISSPVLSFFLSLFFLCVMCLINCVK